MFDDNISISVCLRVVDSLSSELRPFRSVQVDCLGLLVSYPGFRWVIFRNLKLEGCREIFGRV